MKISSIRICFTSIFGSILSICHAQNSTQRGSNDWISNWGPLIQPNDPSWAEADHRVLKKAWEVDPEDDRAVMRGVGLLEIGRGVCILTGRSPRLYIQKVGGDEGYLNFEVSGRAKYVGQPNRKMGFIVGMRSNHGLYHDDPCMAATYYAKLSLQGQAIFQKEYYHHHTSNTKIFSSTKREWVTSFPNMQNGVEENRWYGIKVRVYTSAPEEVTMQMWLDRSSSYSMEPPETPEWELVHTVIDRPGRMRPTRGAQVPTSCEVGTGDVIDRPATSVFLRGDKMTLWWTDVEVTEII